MEILFITSMSVIAADPATSRRLYVDALGLPLSRTPRGDYFHTRAVEGAKHFGVWPLAQAAQACFGTAELAGGPAGAAGQHRVRGRDAAAVAAAEQELTRHGLRPAARRATEPWGQTVARLQSAEARSSASRTRPRCTSVTGADRIVPANGVDLCAEPFGDPTAPAILLLHGAGSTMLSWDEGLCERLAAGGRFVLRYDSRDAGRSVTSSPGAPRYTTRDLVDDAVGLLDAFDLVRAHLVGVSSGGAVAQLAALDHPDRVASLTLIASSQASRARDRRPPAAFRGARSGPHQERAEPDWGDRAAVIDHLVEAERPYAARSRPFDDDAERERAGRVVDRAGDLEASLTNPFLVDPGEGWRRRLAEVAAPTLVVHGAEDPLFPPGHGRALANEIPMPRSSSWPRWGTSTRRPRPGTSSCRPSCATPPTGRRSATPA